MHAEAFIPICIVAVVLAVSFVAGYFQTKKAGENLAKLATRLGLALATTGKYFKKHSLTGELRGRTAEVFNYTTGAGKSKQTWSALAVTAKKTGGLTFTVERRVAFLDLFSRVFRKNEVKTGDAVFDKSWVLKTNRPDFMQAALLPEMRTKLLRFADGSIAAPSFKLETQRVVYAERGSFSSEKICDRIEAAVDVLSDLADVVEVGAEMKE